MHRRGDSPPRLSTAMPWRDGLGGITRQPGMAAGGADLQMQGPMDAEDRLEKLGPILDKLKSLDPQTAAMLSKMVGGASFLQTSGPEVDPVARARWPKLTELE